ncbi:glycoside hydrolase family 108 protein [Lysobacter sp. 1R34A]|uniref:glycoside hydrolase family 108 protein n=1 Tax=Lysobacter sp. 1R34A TaxID=3445786 RepID=UPI003EEB371C
MADFNEYFPQLLTFEGGYVDDPADPGGATNKGITLATFEAHAQSLLGIAPTLDNLKALSNGQAAVLYKTLYWDPLYCDAIGLQCLAEDLFDFQVNAGFHAVLLLQTLLGPPVKADGRFGPDTLAALHAADQAALYPAYRQGRIDYYQSLASEHPVLQRFLPGWLKRAQWFPEQAPAQA